MMVKSEVEVLYKYLDYHGAKQTLEGCAVQLSSPTTFNDPFDMHLGDMLGFEVPYLLTKIGSIIMDAMSDDIEHQLLKTYKDKDKLMHACQYLSAASQDDKKNIMKMYTDSIERTYDAKKMEQEINQQITAIQESLSSYGIFCSSKKKDCLLLWSHYSGKHTGVVLQFQPDEEKDSMFLASRPVMYSHERPVLFRTTQDLLPHNISTHSKDSTEQIIDRLVFTKSVDWVYEVEYRLAIPDFLTEGMTSATLPFHPEELAAVYFGCRISEEHKTELTTLAKNINPDVEFYQGSMAKREYALEWERI